MTIEEITQGLTEAQKRAVMAFAPAFASTSTYGMKREWLDVCLHAGPHRSYYNTIRPLVARGLAERCEDALVRLTETGLAVRTHLEREGHED
jgi:hypothetical protein